MAAIIPSIASLGFRIGRGLIGILAASQVIDILSGGAPTQQAVQQVSTALGTTVTTTQVKDMANRTRAEYVIVHTPSNTIVKVLSKATVFRLLTARRRKSSEKKVVVITAGAKKDITEGNVEIVR